MDLHREDKPHIGLFGRSNVGKSSLMNLLIGQNISIVSQQKGTTTDVVKKTTELYKIGAVVLVDTAGIDDDTLLGEKRIEKTREALSLVDMAIIIIENNTIGKEEEELINKCKEKHIPYVFVYNKNNISPINEKTKAFLFRENIDYITIDDLSQKSKENLTNLVRKNFVKEEIEGLLDGIIEKNDAVILVTPIDSSAPKDRIILPQVKAIRNILDNNAINIVVQPNELKSVLNMLSVKPKLVITDSQAFAEVNEILPKNIELTSFSVLLSKQKGCFEQYLKGTSFLDQLKDGDKVLMLESCTHQPTCEDIGRVKLPRLITKYTGKNLQFKAIAGLIEHEKDIDGCAMVIQCGGCVATRQQIFSRLQPFLDRNIPVSNYGLAIAYMNGIFARATHIFSFK